MGFQNEDNLLGARPLVALEDMLSENGKKIMERQKLASRLACTSFGDIADIFFALRNANAELIRQRDEMAAKHAAANERCAEMAAALERALKLGREIAGFVKSYGLDDVGPQSEWSRYIQCRDGLDNSADPAAVLRTVRQKAAAWALRGQAVIKRKYAEGPHYNTDDWETAQNYKSEAEHLEKLANSLERGDVEVPNE